MPYCRDCGTEIYGSRVYCGECANDIVERSRDRIRAADTDEQRRMYNDRDYAHRWLQSLIGWIIGLMDLMSRIFSGGCYITSAVVAYRGLADDSPEMGLLRTLRERFRESADMTQRYDLDSYSIIGPVLRNWINSRRDAVLIWEYVWLYIKEVIVLVRQEEYEAAYMVFKERTLRLRWDVLCGRHERVKKAHPGNSIQRKALGVAADPKC